MNFGQVITAMATPFDANGEIDFQATTNLVEYLINNGSDGIVVAGAAERSRGLVLLEVHQVVVPGGLVVVRVARAQKSEPGE